MKKHKPRLQKCPYCGNLRKSLWKSHHQRKKYSVECDYCHANAGSAYTRWGAFRLWNRMVSFKFGERLDL